MNNFKKLLILFIFLSFAAIADIMPYYVESVKNNLIGFNIVKSPLEMKFEPYDDSKVIETVTFDYKGNLSCSNRKCNIENVLTAYSQKNEIALMSTIDETEGWSEVCFNQEREFCGWIKEEDNKFYNWGDFYGILGKKYGLYPFKNIDKKDKILYSSNQFSANSTGKMLLPKAIFPWLVRGNWVLVKAHDYDNSIKTGWINYRDENGQLKYFVKF